MKTIFHVFDSTLLESLEKHKDSFLILPFAFGVKENISILEKSDRAKKYKKDIFYARLLQGIDWLVGERRVDILNLSLGLKRGIFDESELIHIATKEAFDRDTIVVTAAGNRGPKNNTLQGIARAPWVISVGATDLNRKLLNRSSRGIPNEIGPTLVTIGHSDCVEKDPRKNQLLPSTSFACARISRILAFVKVMIRHLASYFNAAAKGFPSEKSPPVFIPVVGYADTGVPKDIDKYIHPIAKSLYEDGSNHFSLNHSQDTIYCVNEVTSFLIEKQEFMKFTVEPNTVRNFLVSMCEAMSEYHNFEVGAGFLDERIAVEYWSHFSPQKLLTIQFPNLKNVIDRFFTEKRYFFDREMVEFLYEVSTRGYQAHAKVLE